MVSSTFKDQTELRNAATAAASKGCLPILERFLEHLDIDNLNQPLEAAINKGHLHVVMVILRKGVVPEEHLVCLAASRGYLDIAQLLSDHSAKVQLDLGKVQRRWRKNRLLKAARRAVVFKAELQAVYYSPERLPLLLPDDMLKKYNIGPCHTNDSLRRAVHLIRSRPQAKN